MQKNEQTQGKKYFESKPDILPKVLFLLVFGFAWAFEVLRQTFFAKKILYNVFLQAWLVYFHH